jgi:cytochrome c oxidase cbb3-type subunit 4
VNNITGYFHTDWAAMTLNDWLGVFYAVMAVIVMVFVYVIALHPKHKQEFNSYGDMVLREDREQNIQGDKP